jgi:site-specific DNA-cytosine methylase
MMNREGEMNREAEMRKKSLQLWIFQKRLGFLMLDDVIDRTLDRAKNEDHPTCLVLFDGMGFSRLALQLEGFECMGVELDPNKCLLSDVLIQDHYGMASECVCADVRQLTRSQINRFDAVWCSPPCQVHSVANPSSVPARPELAHDLIVWSLGTDTSSPLHNFTGRVHWVENVHNKFRPQTWGTTYNQAQFQERPTQNRNRVIGGRFPEPPVLRPWQESYRKVAGIRFEQDPTTNVMMNVDIPARDESSNVIVPDAPGFSRALAALPDEVAQTLRRFVLKPVVGIAPVLMASEFKSPGHLTDDVPKVQQRSANRMPVDLLSMISHNSSEPIVRALWARDQHYANDSRTCSRYYRRRITLREALCVMAGECLPEEDQLVQKWLGACPAMITERTWREHILHGLGNAVPLVMVQTLARAAKPLFET